MCCHLSCGFHIGGSSKYDFVRPPIKAAIMFQGNLPSDVVPCVRRETEVDKTECPNQSLVIAVQWWGVRKIAVVIKDPSLNQTYSSSKGDAASLEHVALQHARNMEAVWDVQLSASTVQAMDETWLKEPDRPTTDLLVEVSVQMQLLAESLLPTL